MLVFVFTTAATDVDALVTAVESADVWVLVLALTTAATDEEAEVTSDCVAREPEDSDAPVSVRVPDNQTSAASEP